jgi:hypothetical protein
MRHEQIALIPRQLAAKSRACSDLAKYRPSIAAISEPGWTIRPADGITAHHLLEPAKP